MATHLLSAFRNTSLVIQTVDSHTLNGLWCDSNVILLAVSDNAVAEVASAISRLLPDYNGVVAHSAGSLNMDVLSSFFSNYGVFYPLQTFSRDIPIVDYREIPVFIEGSDQQTVDILDSLARKIFSSVYHLSSGQRKKLHLASVFACNFVNAMYMVAEDLLEETGVSFDFIHALVRQTADKAVSISPRLCQTGPASRGDFNVISSQLKSLDNRPLIQNIYKSITDYIIQVVGNEQD